MSSEGLLFTRVYIGSIAYFHEVKGLPQTGVTVIDSFDLIFNWGHRITASEVAPESENGDVTYRELVTGRVLPLAQGHALGRNLAKGVDGDNELCHHLCFILFRGEKKSTHGVYTVSPHIHVGVSGPGTHRVGRIPAGADGEETSDGAGFTHHAALNGGDREASRRVL